jgi:hypothetical protein
LEQTRLICTPSAIVPAFAALHEYRFAVAVAATAPTLTEAVVGATDVIVFIPVTVDEYTNATPHRQLRQDERYWGGEAMTYSFIGS